MEVSSTTTTSWRSGLSALCRNRVRLPRAEARAAGAASCRAAPAAAPRRSGSTAMPSASARTASSSRAAALPVGAARAMSGGRRARGERLLLEQRQDAGPPSSSSRSPARRRSPRRAGARRRPRPARWRSGSSSPVTREQRRQAGAQERLVDAGRRPRRPGPQVGRHQASRRARGGSRYRFDPSRWSGRSVPDQRALAMCSSPRAGSGQGSAPRSVATSVSAAGRLADVRRSTQTWPSRGARAAKAAPRQTASSVDRAQPRQASARRGRPTSTRTPASLNTREAPVGAERQRRVERVARRRRVTSPAPRVEQVAERLDQPGRRRQDHTPSGVSPADTVGSTALMPRTKRYSTPPRCAAAS